MADKEQMMEKHIVGENGISYTLGADGLYYPDLVLPKGTDYRIGRYGRMRADYIKKHHHSMYLELLFTGKWNEYLHGVDEECYQRLELLVEQMKAGAGVTEKLKATDQMKWVGLMNNLKSCAEEIVLKELIYS
ncbi:MAG TPA: TnpV protein [Lachnospiraceae bacterium]|nr:TnpV protein [Lachnospiraceae bacterium]